MKSAKSLSTEEQKKARQIYNATIWLTIVLLAPIFSILTSVIADYLNPLGVPIKRNYLIGGAPVLALCFGQWWASSRVRRAGLSRELRAIESINKTATELKKEPVQWHYPQRKVWVIALSLFGVVVSLLFRGIQHSNLRTDLVLLAFILAGIACCISGIYSPILRFDEQGVSGVGSAPWTKRIAWSQIAECEISRFQNYLGESAMQTFNFKDANGKSLLSVSPLALLGLPEQEFHEMEAEIKRRMVG